MRGLSANLGGFFGGEGVELTGQITGVVPIGPAALPSPSAVDALRGMRNRLQTSHLDGTAASIALAVAACTNSLQGVLNFSQLPTFDSGELAPQLLLLGGDGGIHLVTDARIGHAPQRPDVASQRATQS